MIPHGMVCYTDKLACLFVFDFIRAEMSTMALTYLALKPSLCDVLGFTLKRIWADGCVVIVDSISVYLLFRICRLLLLILVLPSFLSNSFSQYFNFVFLCFFHLSKPSFMSLFFSLFLFALASFFSTVNQQTPLSYSVTFLFFWWCC